MMKKLLIPIALFLVGGCINFYWGHHFTFTNQMGMPMDSLEITVGDKTTLITSKGIDRDSLEYLEGNIGVPKRGYPHKVKLLIFSNSDTITLHPESFDCYNCDGTHQYILTKDSVKYKFWN